MTESFRVQRVEKQLQEIVSEYLMRRACLTTMTSVSRVESNKELRTAKVYLSVFGEEDQKQEALDLLEDQIYDLQGYVNKNLHMKFVPRISLHLDRGLEHMMKIQSLLSEQESS